MASKDINRKNKIEVAVINTALNKGGQLLEDITYGKSILEYGLENSYLNIQLESNGIDKDGNRFDLETKRIISYKGKNEKPKGSKKANLSEKTNKDDELIQD